MTNFCFKQNLKALDKQDQEEMRDPDVDENILKEGEEIGKFNPNYFDHNWNKANMKFISKKSIKIISISHHCRTYQHSQRPETFYKTEPKKKLLYIRIYIGGVEGPPG